MTKNWLRERLTKDNKPMEVTTTQCSELAVRVRSSLGLVPFANRILRNPRLSPAMQNVPINVYMPSKQFTWPGINGTYASSEITASDRNTDSKVQEEQSLYNDSTKLDDSNPENAEPQLKLEQESSVNPSEHVMVVSKNTFFKTRPETIQDELMFMLGL